MAMSRCAEKRKIANSKTLLQRPFGRSNRMSGDGHCALTIDVRAFKHAQSENAYMMMYTSVGYDT